MSNRIQENTRLISINVRFHFWEGRQKSHRTTVQNFVRSDVVQQFSVSGVRQGERTPLAKRRRQFLTEWPLALARCDRGPDRSMAAGQLLDFLQLLGILLAAGRSCLAWFGPQFRLGLPCAGLVVRKVC